MTKDTEEKVISLLRVLSLHDNWELRPMYDENNKHTGNLLLWNKLHYHPGFVADELLKEIIDEKQSKYSKGYK